MLPLSQQCGHLAYFHFQVSKLGPFDSVARWIGFVDAEPDFGMWPSSHS